MDSDIYVFYQTLTENQKNQVESKLKKAIEEMKSNGIADEQIHQLKCTVAKNMFERRILNG